MTYPSQRTRINGAGIAASLVTLSVGLGVCAVTARADEQEEYEYRATGAYVYSLTEPAIDLPPEMAQHAGEVFLGCESRGLAMAAYGDPADSVGAAGELGQAQIHPIHWREMRLLELDPYTERDRMQYAAHKWHYAGWGPWSCGYKAGAQP